MDLRTYYSRIRETEHLLEGEYIVLVSLKTPEGGKPGVMTETPRAIAAQFISEGRARQASEKEAAEFYKMHRDAKERIDQEIAARRLQVMVIPAHELKQQKERS